MWIDVGFRLSGHYYCIAFIKIRQLQKLRGCVLKKKCSYHFSFFVCSRVGRFRFAQRGINVYCPAFSEYRLCVYVWVLRSLKNANDAHTWVWCAEYYGLGFIRFHSFDRSHESHFNRIVSHLSFFVVYFPFSFSLWYADC